MEDYVIWRYKEIISIECKHHSSTYVNNVIKTMHVQHVKHRCGVDNTKVMWHVHLGKSHCMLIRINYKLCLGDST